MPNLTRSPIAWGVLAFLVGMSVFALVPRTWIFVDPHADHAGAEGSDEVWACPMLCVKLDGPGTCPVCGMDLEKLEDTGDTLILNERERRLVDLQTTEVERRVLQRKLRAFGRIDFNQRRVQRISAWVPGRITRLYADTRYTEVRTGDHLFEIYSPELFAAQSEYLAARGYGGRGLRESAREKLKLFGMTDAQIDAVDASKEAQHKTLINSPSSGTIFDLNVREGDYVKEGSPLYTIADISTLWLLFDAYEADLPWILPGQDVSITLEAWPGRVFHGTVEFIDQAVNEETRTVNVRVVLDNQDGALKPGMFASVEISATLGPDGRAVGGGLEGRYTCYMHPEVHLDAPGDCPICGMPAELHAEAEDDDDPASNTPSALGPPRLLAIPRTAVLDTGERQLVYVMTQPPKFERRGDDWAETQAAGFEAREITLGPEAGPWFHVKSGLHSGDRVVTQGNFLIDSQMELLGKPSLLHAEPSSSGAPADPHAGH